MTPRDAVDVVARLDDAQSRALVAFLNGRVGPGETPAHREIVNGRWACFISYGGQDYCLLPLAPEGVP